MNRDAERGTNNVMEARSDAMWDRIKWKMEAVGRPLENIFISSLARTARVEVPSWCAWFFFSILFLRSGEAMDQDTTTLPKMARAMANYTSTVAISAFSVRDVHQLPLLLRSLVLVTRTHSGSTGFQTFRQKVDKLCNPIPPAFQPH